MNRVETYRGWCKKCGICIAFCPQGVLEANEAGYPVISHPEKCTGCKLCEIRCPDFAIVVSNEEESDSGKNSSAGK